MKGTITVVTLDEQLYSKDKELQWENPEVCSKIFLHLGSFHIAKNFRKAIGQHFTDSGLQSVWAESSVFGDNTASDNMSAESHNRTINAQTHIGVPVANPVASFSRVGKRPRV